MRPSQTKEAKMKQANCEVTANDISRGFIEGRSESMIQEEKDKSEWGIISESEDESFTGGFLGRGRDWER